MGAFATEPIPAGTRVIEYAGARISPEEAHARYPDSTPGATHHTELFAIDDDIVIDASVDGNERLGHKPLPAVRAADRSRARVEAELRSAFGDAFGRIR